MIEKKAMLLLAAAAALALVSVPSVIFNSAIKKYFSFVGHWDVAVIKPSRMVSTPPPRPKHTRPEEPPLPELRFVKFSVKTPDAKEVKIAGDFNKWDPDTLPLTKKEKNLWEVLLPLPPGRYKYLCRIDGKDALDPLNPETDMEAGRKVSVLTVK